MRGKIKAATIFRMESLSGPVLIVEDVPNILELLEVTLRFKGYPVLTASNGSDALDVLERESPVLVITDILMPKMDGFALVFRLRRNPRTNRIPIIFLSATYISPEDKSFAMNLGAVRFLEKPVDTEEFLQTVSEAMLTGIAAAAPPLEERDFYLEYRSRLEDKLRHKNLQIIRTERLLDNLPFDQKPPFQTLLAEAKGHRAEIQRELDEIYRLL